MDPYSHRVWITALETIGKDKFKVVNVYPESLPDWYKKDLGLK